MAGILLDTHVLIWLLDGSPRLGTDARRRIDTADAIAVSVGSLWEIAIKTSMGKLPAVAGIEATIAAGGIRRLGIEPSHLAALTLLAWHPGHRDPFDRLLIAQAQAEELTIVTADRQFNRYQVMLHKVGE